MIRKNVPESNVWPCNTNVSFLTKGQIRSLARMISDYTKCNVTIQEVDLDSDIIIHRFMLTPATNKFVSISLSLLLKIYDKYGIGSTNMRIINHTDSTNPVIELTEFVSTVTANKQYNNTH